MVLVFRIGQFEATFATVERQGKGFHEELKAMEV